MIQKCGHVIVQVFCLYTVTKTVGVGKEKSTVQSIFGKHDIIMKSIHMHLRKFQNRKTGVNGFVLVNFGSKSMNHNQLWVDDFEMFESGQSNQFFWLLFGRLRD